MVDAYVYRLKLPVKEAITPNDDGTYTIYIDNRLDDEHARRVYRHALRHIEMNHFELEDVQRAEREAHRKE